jgi:hypothetical protein
MRKEDWQVIYARKELGVSRAAYRFKDTHLRLEIYEHKHYLSGITCLFSPGILRKYINIEDAMERDDFKEEDKASLAYYINIKYAWFTWEQEHTHEFIIAMHGGMDEWRSFVTENTEDEDGEI